MSYSLGNLIRMEPQLNKIEFLNQFPVFNPLSENVKESIAALMEPVQASRFTYIFRQGESAKSLFLLARGSVKIGSFNAEGKEMIKQILHPEMLFGEMSIFSDEPHKNFAMSFHEEVLYYKVNANSFRELLSHNSDLCVEMMTMIGKRLRNAERRLESLVFKDARARIIDFLVENANRRGKKVGFETLIRHNLTQQDIANFTCTSRQTVTSVLNDLRKANLIYFNRRSFLIRDLAKLT